MRNIHIVSINFIRPLLTEKDCVWQAKSENIFFYTFPRFSHINFDRLWLTFFIPVQPSSPLDCFLSLFKFHFHFFHRCFVCNSLKQSHSRLVFIPTPFFVLFSFRFVQFRGEDQGVTHPALSIFKIDTTSNPLYQRYIDNDWWQSRSRSRAGARGRQGQELGRSRVGAE